MAIIKLSRDLFEHASVKLKPKTEYITSGSGLFVTGAQFLMPVRTKRIKILSTRVLPPQQPTITDLDLIAAQETHSAQVVAQGISCPVVDINPTMTSYMNSVELAKVHPKYLRKILINRVTMSDDYALGYQNKDVKRGTKYQALKTLTPHYSNYINPNFAYTNYNCLNFFTASSVSSNTALVYPNVTSSNSSTPSYTPSDSATINFWINPKYTSDEPETLGNFKAGTIFHISSSIAISLITGSSRDNKGYPDKFNILLQLSHSADIPPSTVSTKENLVFPRDLIFSSSDNFLDRNVWTNVTVRWSANTNSKTGSIKAVTYKTDDTGSLALSNKEAKFIYPSSSLTWDGCLNHEKSTAIPYGLCIGNFFEGSGSQLAHLFNTNAASSEGIKEITGSSTYQNVLFNHDLNAEIHDIKFYKDYLFDEDILEISSQGDVLRDSIAFYLPPFFDQNGPDHLVLQEARSMRVNPAAGTRLSQRTSTPINANLAFTSHGHEINVANFCRDYATSNFPRLFNLTSSGDISLNSITQFDNANKFLYNHSVNVKRALFILPNDNGLFRPNFGLLQSGSTSESAVIPCRYINRLGNKDLSLISLENLILSGTIQKSTQHGGLTFIDTNNDGVEDSDDYFYRVLQVIRETSYDHSTFYDISDIYYGDRINPGSFSMYDKFLSGGDGKVKIKLKDNERGSLYRSDAESENAKWNSVGTLFYNEGIVFIKSPHLFNYGLYENIIEFKGEQTTHVLTINCPVPTHAVNDPSVTGSLQKEAVENMTEEFAYITDVNIHDDNLNVIMRASLSQAVKKNVDDEFMIKLKKDY